MFGVNPSEFIVLLVVAAVVLGPERLPEYAAQLARLIRELRRMAQGASTQVRKEMGPEFDEIDWAKLDPRQYDPRRIVREALADVWDPDDPLGLNEGNRSRRPGDDLNGAPPRRSGWETEKPQSVGGPAAAAAGAARSGANGVGVNLRKGAPGEAALDGASASDSEIVEPPPPFDPDAT